MSKNAKKMSIKTKFILMVFLTSFSVLLIENITFTIDERVQETNEVIHNTQSFARIISNYNAKFLLQNDQKTAQESLDILKIENFIVAACIYDLKGKCFASYDSGKTRPFEFPTVENLPTGVQIDKDYLQLSEPIISGGVTIGNVLVRASLQELNLRWQNFLLTRLSTILVGSFFLYIITLKLQRSIAKPLANLTFTARTVVATKNYRMRVMVENDDEIGALARTINNIIEAVEKRDVELRRCNERLAHFEQQIDYPADLLALSSLHIADGLEHIGGNEQAYRKQLRRFRQHFADAIQDLRNIVFNEKDIASAGVYLNALQGVSGNIGASSLFRYVSHLSSHLRENRPLEEKNLQRLESLLKDVFRDIDSLPPEKISASNVEKSPFSPAALLAKTDELLATLENDLGESEQHLTQLCEIANGSEFETLTEAIAAQLDKFNIEQASLLLGDLKQRLTLASS